MHAIFEMWMFISESYPSWINNVINHLSDNKSSSYFQNELIYCNKCIITCSKQNVTSFWLKQEDKIGKYLILICLMVKNERMFPITAVSLVFFVNKCKLFWKKKELWQYRFLFIFFRQHSTIKLKNYVILEWNKVPPPF